MRIGPFLTSSIAFQERYNLTINNMAPPNAEAVAVQVDQEIYGRSGDLDKHMEGVKAQYDTKEKLEFYAQVMGDGTANIHFGKWDVSLSQCHKFTQSHRDRLSYQHALLHWTSTLSPPLPECQHRRGRRIREGVGTDDR